MGCVQAIRSTTCAPWRSMMRKDWRALRRKAWLDFGGMVRVWVFLAVLRVREESMRGGWRVRVYRMPSYRV